MTIMTPVCRRVHVRVPATSANLGSGFDTVGLALDYHDDIDFTLSDDPDDSSVRVLLHGEGENSLPRDETHLVVSAFRQACRTFGLGRPGLVLEAWNRIPQARGMGSSAEAIVAGIGAAAAMLHEGEISRQTIFDLAAVIEGHPDNVAPAVFGGLTVSWNMAVDEGVGSVQIAGGEPVQPGFHTLTYPVADDVLASVLIPDFELSTQKARQVLPERLPYRDAVYDVSRVGLMPGAMNPRSISGGSTTDPNALLFAATQDRMHQPYRRGLMKPSWNLIEDLRERGFAAAVSGAGPCVLVLHHGDARADIEAVAGERLSSGHWRVLHLPVSSTGVEVERR